MPGLTTSCWSKDGERLYGERGSTEDATMGCQCARLHYAETDVEGLGPRPHCLTDGNFDTLQCSNATCFCVDQTNGTITSVIASRPFKDLLPCFNATIHRKDYLKPCELAAQQLEQERADWAQQGFSLLGAEPPRCDIGGFFDKVQVTQTGQTCVTPEGADLHYTVPRSSAAAVSMTCNCARSSYHMQSAGQMTDLPQCCDNGDFRPYQCRGLFCYCVDADGQQYGGAEPQSSLQLLKCSQQLCPSTAAGSRPDGGWSQQPWH
ncbi:thyroglobulin-like [Pollicipes pollicipes]|uniref:thyroglobulin-like n=1 Tax=Pollicipes pollicipes TaxID=41117 RepID=UPI0018859147|nr:thyroglobulin-like [Pollicipes pollicipes]